MEMMGKQSSYFFVKKCRKPLDEYLFKVKRPRKVYVVDKDTLFVETECGFGWVV